MPPPTTTTTRPGRYLAALVVLIVIMLLGVLGGSLPQPGHWQHRFKVGLGLDLSSGTTVTLKAVTPNKKAPSSQAMATAVSIMNSRVNGAGFNGATVVPQGNDLINVTVPGKGVQQVVNLVGTTAQLRFRQVLLMAPNYASAATPSTTPTPSPSTSPTTSPSTTPSSSGSPSPHASSSTKAKVSARAAAPGARLLAAGAQQLGGAPTAARVKPKPAASPSPSASASPSSPASSTPRLSTVADGTGAPLSQLSSTVKSQFNRLNCADKNWRTVIYGNNPNNWDNTGIQTVACYQDQKYVLDKSTVTGEMLKLGGSSTQLQTNGDYWVNLTFNGQGTKAFGALSTKMYNSFFDAATNQPKNEQDFFAIVLDGTPVSVPYMAAVLDSGSATIQGTFSQSSAGNLANVLNYGALPLTFHEEQAQSISAQLGSSYLHTGLLAGLVGLILVVIYAFIYYRGLGLVAVSSLAIAALLSYLAVVLLSLYESFAMSLAGIAGLIVAIGITADSFVVFFERLRDEVREGKTLRSAVERGWQRARRTILVSDTVSFIAAAVLYKFAVTDVQNFAFTLGLTTLVDVIVVFLFTKPTITLLARTKFYGGGHRLSGLDPARLGARSPWRGTRRQATRPAGRPRPGPAQAARAPGANPPSAQPRTNPKEA